jgi:putative iron-dependent peroxidase
LQRLGVEREEAVRVLPSLERRALADGSVGKIFRRNMPYGTVTNHGTMFVGFSADQRRLSAMLKSMAGLAGRPRDALTLYTRALTGAYYFVPASDSLRRFIPDEDSAE